MTQGHYPQRPDSWSLGVRRASLPSALLGVCLAAVTGCEREQPVAGAATDTATDPAAAPADLRTPPADAERTSEGLVSKVLRPGHGSARPGAFDRVSMHYAAWTEDGALFASSYLRGAPATMRVDEVMRGFGLGLQRMVTGEKRRLWVPPALTDADMAADTPGGGALVIDVELLELLPGEAPLRAPPDLQAPPPDAERTDSGLAHALLVASAKTARPDAHDRARVVYAGWSRDGRMIDSSHARGAFAEVALSQGFPGFREALALLREGEKRRFWIPEALAYEHHPGAVAGPLVFDIELLAIVDMPSPPPVPADVAAPPPRAPRMPSGVVYRVLQPGSGTRRPGPRSAVDFHYSYWTTRGKLVDSTLPNGRPHRADFKDRDLPLPVVEALQQMVAGERRRLWVPEALGFPGQRQAALGPLVFDLELIAVYERKVQVDSVAP